MVRGLGVLVCLGAACSMSPAQELLVNGGFEEPADGPASGFTGWEVWRGSGLSTSGVRVNEPVASGRWALSIRMLPHGGSQIVEQRFTGYDAGQLYEVVFEARSMEPYDAFRVSVIDRSPTLNETATLGNEAFTNLGWTRYAVRFTAPAEPGHPLYVRLQAIGPKPDSGVWFDDVRILPVSAAAAEFAEVQTEVENDSFNVLVGLEFDLRTEADIIRWLLADLREFEVADLARIGALQARLEALDDRIAEGLAAVAAEREERLHSSTVLSGLTDEQIADRAREVATLADDLSAAANALRSEVAPALQVLAEDADALQGDWQPPAEEPVRYRREMLGERFHRIISYSPQRMPVSEYMRRSLMELQPTLIIGNPHPDYADPERVDLLRRTLPRTQPYIMHMTGLEWFDPDLTAAKQSIDTLFAEHGENPAFAGVDLDEPSITDGDVCTPEGYAAFREWLRERLPEGVGGVPLTEALAWEQPEAIETDRDRVMWMELQQFKTQWMARQLARLQEYVYSRRADAIFHVVIQQFLPSTPQRASYVTVPAALDWISMDPYNNANVGEALLMDLLRSNSRGPNLLVVGTCYDRTPARFAKDLSISFAHAGGVYAWTYCYMSAHRSPVGVTAGAWPVRYRDRWKPGMYEAALDVMGEMAAIEPYLIRTQSAAKVGLIYSERTGIDASLPDTPDYYVDNLGIYQALQQAHIPTDALFAEAMTAEKLANFGCLVLVDAELLTDEEATLLADWCWQGGSLLLLGAVGGRDQWGRPREDFGPLTELLGVRRIEQRTGAVSWQIGDGPGIRMDETWPYEAAEPVDPDAEVIGRFDTGDIAAIRRPHGRGQIVWLTAHNLGLSFDGSKYLKGMDKQYWPGFRETLSGLVDDALSAAGVTSPVRAEGAPDNVEVAVRRQGDRLIVHLLNYDDAAPISGVVLTAPGQAEARAFYPVDGEEAQVTPADDGLRVSMRDFDHHCCVVIVSPGR